jgi:hypothetical protein
LIQDARYEHFINFGQISPDGSETQQTKPVTERLAIRGNVIDCRPQNEREKNQWEELGESGTGIPIPTRSSVAI